MSLDATTIFMFAGFLLAAYSVIGNDSVQTLGTFIASNKKTKWQYMWIFTSVILITTLSWSWYSNGGDISYGRLNKIPFVTIEWYHVLAPLVLAILTRFGVPISTSLLVLSAFASGLVFEKILLKSAVGYSLAAIIAYVLWVVINKWDNMANPVKEKNKKKWRLFQWFATGFLWYSWLSHDIANIAVFLPRQLSFEMLIFVLAVFVTGLAFIFWDRGGKIQHIVQSKTNTKYVRSASIIDLLYAFILVYLKQVNDIPMSTTWVFVGLLTGRELAIATMAKEYTFKAVFPLVGKDLLKLLFGLIISVFIALFIQNIEEVLSYVGF